MIRPFGKGGGPIKFTSLGFWIQFFYMNRNLKPEWNVGIGNMIWYCQGPAVQYCPVYQGLRCKQGPDPTCVNLIVRILPDLFYSKRKSKIEKEKLFNILAAWNPSGRLSVNESFKGYAPRKIHQHKPGFRNHPFSA